MRDVDEFDVDVRAMHRSGECKTKLLVHETSHQLALRYVREDGVVDERVGVNVDESMKICCLAKKDDVG